MEEVHNNLTGRFSERPVSFPDVFICRARAGDGVDCLATFDRSTIVLSRPVAGLACKIRLSLRQYQAIAVVARDEGNIVRLTHRDPGLSVDIAEIADFAEAEAYRDRLANFLKLPTLTLAGSGSIADARVGGLSRAARSGRIARSRRPRFLTRRRTGEVISIRKVEGHELVARH